MRRLSLLLAALFALASQPAHATFVIVNLDGPGEGFNDPTPVAPVGGNPGTTVGQQRLNVVTQAGQIWDAILNIPIPIRVRAQFDPLPCGVTSGVRGSAGPTVWSRHKVSSAARMLPAHRGAKPRQGTSRSRAGLRLPPIVLDPATSSSRRTCR